MPMTSAEKQAAYRARQKESQASSVAEEAYVQEQVRATQAMLDAGQAKDTDSEGNSLHRVARAESYARFRWAGVTDGSIAGL